MEVFFLIIIIIALFILGIFSYTWYRLHISVNLHAIEDTENPSKYGISFEKKTLITSDNIKISSWYTPVKNPKAFVILVHGYQTVNGGRSLMSAHLKYLYQAGYSTLSISSRSVGESQGKKISFGVHEWKDVQSAYDYLKTLPEVKNKKIGFFGISMGASTVIVTAGLTGKGDFVIASVPYANFTRLFEFQIRSENLYVPIFLPLLRLASLLEFGLKYENFTPSNLIAKIHVPIFLIGANFDEKVNCKDAKYLYDIANQPKTFWQADTKHDVFKYKPDEFKSKVLHFLKTC